MAVTSFAAASFAVSAYSAYKSSQSATANVDPASLLATAPKASDDALRVAAAGQQAAIAQKRKSAPLAQSSNILTSPQGTNAPAPGLKQLTGQ